MEIWSLKWKLLPILVLFLSTICSLQQLKMFFSDFFNLVLVCKVIKPRYGRIKTRGLFSIFREVSFTMCFLSLIFLKLLLIKFSGLFYKFRKFVILVPEWKEDLTNTSETLLRWNVKMWKCENVHIFCLTFFVTLSEKSISCYLINLPAIYL